MNDPIEPGPVAVPPPRPTSRHPLAWVRHLLAWIVWAGDLPVRRPAAGGPAQRLRLAWYLLARAMWAYRRVINGLSSSIGWAVSSLTVVLVLLTCYRVIVRKVTSYDWFGARWWEALHLPTDSILAYETQNYLFAMIFMLAASWTLRHDRHVRVDILYQRFGVRLRAAVNLVALVLFFTPFVWLLTQNGLRLTRQSIAFGEVSAQTGGFQHMWLIKAIIPVTGLLLGLQGLALLCQHLVTVVTGWEPPHDPGDGTPQDAGPHPPAPSGARAPAAPEGRS